MQKITSSGSGDIYLGPAPEFNNSSTYFQIEALGPWSGSFVVATVVAGSTFKLPSSYGRLLDSAILTGSIASYVMPASAPIVQYSGSFAVDTGGQDLYLRHIWNSGSVDIYYTVIRD